MRKCFYGYSHLTTGPSYYPKCTLCTAEIFFIGMSAADDVNFGGRDNGHIAHGGLGRKCQSGRTSSLFSFEFSLPKKSERTIALWGFLLSIRCSTAKILFLKWVLIMRVSIAGSDNWNVARGSLGRKCQNWRTSSMFSFEFLSVLKSLKGLFDPSEEGTHRLSFQHNHSWNSPKLFTPPLPTHITIPAPLTNGLVITQALLHYNLILAA